MSINYVVPQGGVACGPHNGQLELPQAHDLVEVNVSQAQSDGVQLTTHWDAVSTEPENLIRPWRSNISRCSSSSLSPSLSFSRRGPHWRVQQPRESLAASSVSGGLPCEDLSIARHIVSKYLGTGKVICGVCGKRYARRDAFKSHLVNGIQCNGTQFDVLAV
ncbi:hypothetical protein BJ138DRAFT_1165766 [Hygrophoropsis aurantiaca]|uniref:Uncharacterized protein n=1 Tax=Hygrophoropsis aurantiaca TaxID=72124 RepID=A0ACB7ZVK4_9AGAM|nr:hypothetical protein BJ138DRAFT_1165766 [Hygrophoropsis aurantiaca]